MPQWPAVQHLSFPVGDIQRAAAFYRDVLGFEQLHVSDDIGELLMGETKLVLLRGSGTAAPTDLHFGFRVDSRTEVDEWGRRARTAGCRIDFGPGQAEWGGYVVYFRDPDGYQVEIWSDA